jgi:hypothetical protein
MSALPQSEARRPLLRRLLRRGPLEAIAVTAIAAGVAMMMQPFSLWLYSESFRVILVATIAYVIVSKLPD